MEAELPSDMAAQLAAGASGGLPVLDFSQAAAGGLLGDAWSASDAWVSLEPLPAAVAGAAAVSAGEMLQQAQQLGPQAWGCPVAAAPTAPSRALAPAGAAATAGKKAVRPPDPWEWPLGQPPPLACRLPGCLLSLPAAGQAARTEGRAARYSRRQGVCMEHLRAPEVELDGYRLRFCQVDKRSCIEKLALHAKGQKVRYHEMKAGRKPAGRRGARAAAVNAVDDGRDAHADAAAFGADGFAAAVLPWAGAGAGGLHPAGAYEQQYATLLAPDVLLQAQAGMQRVGRQAGRVEHRLEALAPLLPVPPPPPSEAALLVATVTPTPDAPLLQQLPLGAAMVRSPSINSGGSLSPGGLSGLTALAVQMNGLAAAGLGGSDSDEARRRASEDSVGRPAMTMMGRPPLSPPVPQHPAAAVSGAVINQSMLQGPAVLAAGMAGAPYQQQSAALALALTAAETRAAALHATAEAAQLKAMMVAHGLVPMPDYTAMAMSHTVAAMAPPPLAPSLMAPSLAALAMPPPVEVMQQQQVHALAAAARAVAMQPECSLQPLSAARLAEETAHIAAIAAARSGGRWPGPPPPSPPMQ